MMKPKKRRLLPLILMMTAATFVSSCSQLNIKPSNNSSESSPEPSSPSNSQSDSSSESSSTTLKTNPQNANFVTQVVENVSPAVVRVNVKKVVRTNVPDVFNNPFFERFFGDAIP
ncbi:MAG: peptidase S1, partial [Halothece sp.]